VPKIDIDRVPPFVSSERTARVGHGWSKRGIGEQGKRGKGKGKRQKKVKKVKDESKLDQTRSETPERLPLSPVPRPGQELANAFGVIISTFVQGLEGG
jgi:hypothetical protein